MSVRFQQQGWRAGVGLLVLLLPLVWMGCGQPMAPGRGAPSANYKTPDNRNFGEEVYKILLREAALHPTLSSQRTTILKNLNDEWQYAATINRILPLERVQQLNRFMQTLLPLFDDETLPKVTRKLSKSLLDLAQEKDALNGVLEVSKRGSMYPPLQKGDNDWIHRLLGFSKYKETLTKLADWWLKHDGLDDKLYELNSKEKPLATTMLTNFGEWLQRTNFVELKDQTTLLHQLLMLENKDLQTNGLKRRCFVQFDRLGKPVRSLTGLRLEKDGKTLPPPFGKPGTTGRGTCGEALSSTGEPLYKYRDLSKTVLASLLVRGRALLKQEMPLKKDQIPFPLSLTVAMRPLLSPVMKSGGYSENSPMIQLVKSNLAMLRAPELYKLIEGLSTLVKTQEAEFAQTLSFLDEVSAIAEKYKNAELTRGSTVIQDLLKVMRKLMASPGFLRDVLKALQTPGLREKLKQGLTQMMIYRGNPTGDDYRRFLTGQKAALFDKKVDHNKGDTADNQSYFTKLLNLLADVTNKSYISRLKAVDGTEIPFIEMRMDDLALLYVRSITGDVSIWDVIYVNGKPIEEGTLKDALRQSLSEFGLSERPNPIELGLFINRKLYFSQVNLLGTVKMDIQLDPVLGHSGLKVRERNASSMIAAIGAGLLGKDGGALRPLVEVFKKHKKASVLLELFGVLQRHWASTSNTDKNAKGGPFTPEPRSNLVSFEGMMLELLESTNLLERLERFGKILLDINVQQKTEPFTTATQKFLVYALGKAGTDVKKSPLGQFMDAGQRIVETLSDAKEFKARKAWEDTIKLFSDLLLQVEGKGKDARFKNRKAAAMLKSALDFLAVEVKERASKGQWLIDVRNIEKSLIKDLTDPVLPSMLDMLDSVVKVDGMLNLTADFLLHIIPDPDKEPKRFGELLGMVATVLSPLPDTIDVPWTRALGRVIGKNSEMVSWMMMLMKKTLPVDKEQVLIQLLRNAVDTHPTQGNWQVASLGAMVKEFYRLKPGSKDPLTVQDLQAILQKLARYLVDKKTGLEKAYNLIQQRKGNP